MPLEPGARLGRYEILASLGAGGMGEVYKARDTQLGREVAVKLLLEAVAGDAERLSRFEREARVLASLNHPNIATLHGYERDGATSFLVMELVEGETLADRIARGPVPLDEALSIFLQIADGLSAAHQAGVVHRDLKPANVKLGGGDAGTQGAQDTRIKILDFGLAKALAGELSEDASADASASPTLTLAATMRGEILGTAAYMAPEQASGGNVDRRADIWAFGVCLYEALTGSRAFQGDTAAGTLAKVLEREPDWQALPSGLPAAVIRLLRRCLAKSPRERLRDIADARLELREARDTPEVTTGVDADPSIGGWRARIAVLVAFAAGTLIALAIAAFLDVPPSTPGKVHFELSGDELRYQIAASPDGRWVAYVEATLATGPRLLLRTLQAPQPVEVPGSSGASFPFWSPDSRSVAFFSEGQLKRFDLGSPAPVRLCEAPAGRGGSWSSSGILFADLSAKAILQVSPNGGVPVPMLEAEAAGGRLVFYPRWLPDGRRFVFLAAPTEALPGAGGAILAAETGSSEVRRLLDSEYSAWVAPEGWLLYAEGGQGDARLMARRLDLGSLELEGGALPLFTEFGVFDPLRISDVSTSDSGLLAYRGGFSAGLSRLTWFDRQGRQLAQVRQDVADFIEWPRLSPDGARLALTAGRDIWLMDLERESYSRLTFEQASNYPAWSPDGRFVVSTRLAPGGGSRLERRRISRTGEVETLLESEGLLIAESFSPDGSLLLFSSSDQGTLTYVPEAESRRLATDLWVLPLEGDREPYAFLETPFVEWNAQISPDGRWVAYAADESGSLEVYVRDFPAGESRWRISASGGVEPHWSPAGDEILYLSRSRELVAVPVSVENGEPVAGRERVLFQSPALNTGRPREMAFWDLSADGERMLMTWLTGGGAMNIVLDWTSGLEER